MKIHLPTPEDDNRNIDYTFKLSKAYSKCFTSLHEAIIHMRIAVESMDKGEAERATIKDMFKDFISQFEVEEIAAQPEPVTTQDL